MKARVTWAVDPPHGSPRLYPGIMFDGEGGSWSVVVFQHPNPDPDIFDVTMLVEDGPLLIPGMAFDVFQGHTKTCRIEILED